MMSDEAARAASMGPQLDSCGRNMTAEAGRFLRELQWGRNLIVAEGPRPPRRPWKHHSFNGAAT